jgi:hypothetical protein
VVWLLPIISLVSFLIDLSTIYSISPLFILGDFWFTELNMSDYFLILICPFILIKFIISWICVWDCVSSSSDRRIPLCVICKADLVIMNYFILCLTRMVFIYPSVLWIFLDIIIIVGSYLLLVIQIFHALLAF